MRQFMTMHPSLSKTDHRPWPLPSGEWRWRQSWNDLLFVHYLCPKKKLRHLVPESLTLQEFNGECWIGIIPLKMDAVTMRPFPAIPRVSYFLELNVRLYVEFEGKSGVYFLSLDATNPLAVWLGKYLFHLPYKHADIEFKKENDKRFFHSRRKEGEDQSEFSLTYSPTSEIFEAKPGTLEHFLTERYCLYTQTQKGLFRGNVHHIPWPLQKSKAEVFSNTILPFQLGETKPHILYSKGVDVILWNLEKINSE
jgi:uncharacterized protein